MANTVLDHKKVLQELGALIEREKNCIARIYPDVNAESCKQKKETLEQALSKTGEEFKVLVIGTFSSGKSCMINALIGEELLPTGFLPETAVIGELHYGAQKRITLYPKKGQWEGGDQPFDLREATPEEIAKYVSLTADDAVNNMHRDEMFSENSSEKRIESKFEKMVIYWPLDILKDGVVLVDSPGINDPYSSDYIVNSYLPQADAIVYVMKAIDAYSGTDVEQLNAINAIGFRNITTGYTWYDAVVSQNRKPEKLQQVRDRLISYMTKHTDLGVQSIHFLSSMDALEAKEKNDAGKLKESGFAGFEGFLGQYLVEGKGTDQVRNMAATIILQSRAMMRDAKSFDEAAGKDMKELEARIKNAQAELNTIRVNSLNAGNNFQTHLKNNLPQARNMISQFVSTLADAVDLEGFEPDTRLPTGPRKLWPFGENGVRHLANELKDECQQELERRMGIALRSWCNKDLNDYMTEAIKESVDTIRPNLVQIARDLEQVNTTISGGDVTIKNGDASNIALGVAYALLTGDWFTGGMSAVYGKGAMGRAVAFQFAAGIGLGLLAAAGVVVTLPAIIVASLGASILAVLSNNNEKQVEKIKKQVVSNLRESFKGTDGIETRESIVDGVMSQIETLVQAACDDMNEALRADIQASEDSIQQRITVCSADQSKKEAQKKAWEESVNELQDIEKKALAICGEYGIPNDFLQVKI